jgi:hypothetical protein
MFPIMDSVTRQKELEPHLVLVKFSNSTRLLASQISRTNMNAVISEVHMTQFYIFSTFSAQNNPYVLWNVSK